MFKAWDNDNKSWLNSFFVRNDGEVLVPIHIIDNTNLISLKAVNATLCRSTGLKDKNGVMIFENDILSNGDDIFIVSFDKGAFFCCSWPFFELNLSSFEKVCNIFEHEHLLKGN